MFYRQLPIFEKFYFECKLIHYWQGYIVDLKIGSTKQACLTNL